MNSTAAHAGTGAPLDRTQRGDTSTAPIIRRPGDHRGTTPTSAISVSAGSTTLRSDQRKETA